MTKKNVVGETMERAVAIATCRGLADICRQLAKVTDSKDAERHFEILGSDFESMGRLNLGVLAKEMEPKKRKKREKKPLDDEVLGILKGKERRKR